MFLLVIPARYGSTRLPGKPLIKINGVAMVERIYRIATMALDTFAKHHKSSPLTPSFCRVATDDERIISFCNQASIPVVFSDKALQNGSERAWQTFLDCGLKEEDRKAIKYIFSVQGDAPLTLPWYLEAMLEKLYQDSLAKSDIQVLTPVISLSWDELAKVKDHKIQNPFSGCLVVTDVNNDALYFSKSLIPAIRNSESLKSQSLSPVLRHIGIYGYRRDVLEQYVKLKPPLLEELEGLEQLRLLYHGIKVRTLKVESRGWPIFSGVDSPADLKVVEELLKTRGDFINSPEKIA